MRAVVVACLGLAGCKPEPSLRVEVEHPPALTAESAGTARITRTTITVYEAESVTCAAIEFGDLAGAQLDILEVARFQADSMKSAGGFDNVFSRTAHKAIVARGFSSDDELVAAECLEVDTVGEGQTITIATVPAATVSVAATDDVRVVLVAAIDPLNRPISGRAVSWRLFGAIGTSADESRFTNVADGVWEPKQPTCTRGGEAKLHPAPPTLQGAYAIQTRFQWAKQRPPLFTQTTELVPIESIPIDPSPDVLKPCALKVANTTSVVCIDQATTNPAVREHSLSGNQLTAGDPVAVASADPLIGVVSLENGNNRDVYAISNKGEWFALFGAPGTGAARLCPAGPGCTVADFAIAPACGTSQAALFAKLTNAPTSVKRQPVKGMGAAQDHAIISPTATIGDAGCLAELQANGSSVIRQVVVIEGTDVVGPAARALFDCAAPNVTTPVALCSLPLFTAGVGFTRAPDHQMITSGFDATGTVLTTVVAVPTEDADGVMQERMIERARQPAAAPPNQIAVGNFDDDGKSDLIWHFGLNRNSSSYQLAYAQRVENRDPITALLIPSERETALDLFVADFDGDGRDDAIAVGDKGGARTLRVARLGTPITTPAPMADPPCPCADPPCTSN